MSYAAHFLEVLGIALGFSCFHASKYPSESATQPQAIRLPPWAQVKMPSRWQNFKASISPANTPVFAAAPTQKVRFEEFAGRTSLPSYPTDEKNDVRVSLESDVTSAKKPNVFDKITRGAGSSGTFFVMIALLGVWAVAGIVYGPTDTWQIILQNASSIQVYVTDILLIRQQKNASRALMTTLAEIQYVGS